MYKASAGRNYNKIHTVESVHDLIINVSNCFHT
jgi:hypothetical protein